MPCQHPGCRAPAVSVRYLAPIYVSTQSGMQQAPQGSMRLKCGAFPPCSHTDVSRRFAAVVRKPCQHGFLPRCCRGHSGFCGAPAPRLPSCGAFAKAMSKTAHASMAVLLMTLAHCLLHTSGSRKVNVLPFPGALSTVTAPPESSAARRAIESPRPSPFVAWEASA